MKSRQFSAALALVLAAACSQEPVPPPDPDVALSAIHAAEETQVSGFASRDVDAGLAPYTDTSVFAQGGAPYLEGLAAIRPAFEAMMADPVAKLEMTPRNHFIAASGELAVTTADYSYTYTDPKTQQPVTEQGVNQTVWKKQADGEWKNVSDFNVATVPPPAKKDAAE